MKNPLMCIALLAALCACGAPATDPLECDVEGIGSPWMPMTPPDSHDFEIDAVAMRATDFRTSGFERVTPELRTSQVPPKEDGPVHVALWASDDASSRYRGIDPVARTDASDGEAFPVDSILMREVRTSDNHQDHGESVKIMAKLSKGYSPARKDWWFGERTDDGQIHAAPRPCECMGCHSLHEATDYVVGAPPVGFEPDPAGTGPYY